MLCLLQSFVLLVTWRWPSPCKGDSWVEILLCWQVLILFSMLFHFSTSECCMFAFGALTLLVWHQEEHLACEKWMTRCWHGYLSGVGCIWFVCRPADATATPSFLSYIKIQIGLTFLVPAYQGCRGTEAVKQVSVCLPALRILCVQLLYAVLFTALTLLVGWRAGLYKIYTNYVKGCHFGGREQESTWKMVGMRRSSKLNVIIFRQFFANPKSDRFSDSFTSDSHSNFILESLLLSFVTVHH